jgi:hypothetical protein
MNHRFAIILMAASCCVGRAETKTATVALSGVRAELISTLLSKTPAGDEEKSPIRLKDLFCRLDRANGRTYSGVDCVAGKKSFPGQLASALYLILPNNLEADFAAGHVSFEIQSIEGPSTGTDLKITYPLSRPQ